MSRTTIEVRGVRLSALTCHQSNLEHPAEFNEAHQGFLAGVDIRR